MIRNADEGSMPGDDWLRSASELTLQCNFPLQGRLHNRVRFHILE